MPVVVGRPQIMLHRRQTELDSGLAFVQKEDGKSVNSKNLDFFIFLSEVFLAETNSFLPVIGTGRWCWFLEVTPEPDNLGYTGLLLPS